MSDDPLHVVCNAIEPKSLNAALRGAFDARDYFDGVSKALCLAAIGEALGPDLARQQAKNKRPEIVAFALANVPPTGWLPPQLRAAGYDGPPMVKAALAESATPQKRAAAAGKVAKKTFKTTSSAPAKAAGKKKPKTKARVKTSAKPSGKAVRTKPAAKKKKA